MGHDAPAQTPESMGLGSDSAVRDVSQLLRGRHLLRDTIDTRYMWPLGRRTLLLMATISGTLLVRTLMCSPTASIYWNNAGTVTAQRTSRPSMPTELLGKSFSIGFSTDTEKESGWHDKATDLSGAA